MRRGVSDHVLSRTGGPPYVLYPADGLQKSALRSLPSVASRVGKCSLHLIITYADYIQATMREFC